MKIEINTKNIRIAVEDEPTIEGGSWTLRRVPEFVEAFEKVMEAVRELEKNNTEDPRE